MAIKRNKYYRVKSEYDGKQIILHRFKREEYYELIGNELLTPYFVEKHNISHNMIDEVMIPTCNIYWAWGARFSIDKTWSGTE